MEIKDDKKKCILDGCENLREWDCIKRGKVYRRRMCSTHRLKLKKNYSTSNKYGWPREKFKRDSCGKCEYCEWVGPCDCHRPISGKEGGRYVDGNMRAICPNCHRKINLGLMVDKFKELN